MEQFHRIKACFLGSGGQRNQIRDRGNYVLVNRQETHVAQEAAVTTAESSYPSHRQPLPRMATRESSRIPRVNTPMTDVLLQRDDQPQHKANYTYELWENLKAEREQLLRHQSYMNERNDIRRRRLESLKARDDAEKWEDELYETRAKELNSAHAIIETHSSATGRNIRKQVEDLNQQIVHISSAAIGVSLAREDRSRVSESITNILGQGFLFLFQRSEGPLESKEIVQAVLQIFLARSCVELIDFWYVGRDDINSSLDQLYNRILSKGESQDAVSSVDLTTNSRIAKRGREMETNCFQAVTTRTRARSITTICNLQGRTSFGDFIMCWMGWRHFGDTRVGLEIDDGCGNG